MERNALELPPSREISSPCKFVIIVHPIVKKTLLPPPRTETQTNYQAVTQFAAWKFLPDTLPLHWPRRSEEALRRLNQEFKTASASDMSSTRTSTA